jgi:hypothetical protein
MAPEISTGNYNKQIDVYAAGIILYEMLTGHVPFEGESAGEILMKHLTAPPDLSKLPSEYLPIVQKALSKNPAQRYASMAEMARAVELLGGRAHVPESKPVAHAVPVLAAVEQKQPDPIPAVLPVVTFRGRLLELLTSMTVAVLFAAVGALLWAAGGGTESAKTLFFLTVAASWAVLVPSKVWTERRGDPWGRRLVLLVVGAGLGCLALWMTGWRMSSRGDEAPDGVTGLLQTLFAQAGANEGQPAANGAAYLSYFALSFFALRWWRMTDRKRSRRFSFFPVLAAGFWSAVLLLLVGQALWPGAVALMMTAATVQLASPWEQPPAPAPKRLRLRYA